MKLHLEFVTTQTPAHRARLEYAFRCFCAIYGHDPLIAPNEMSSADLRISYSTTPGTNARPVVCIPDLYRPRALNVPAPAPQFVKMGTSKMPLIHGCTRKGPDWLGEIFEWLSCSDEYSITDRDSVGRIPFDRSYVSRHALDACVPYAALAMRGMQQLLCQDGGVAVPPKHPCNGTGQFVVNTHDVDFFPLTRGGTLFRAAKNSLLSLLVDKQPATACSQAVAALKMAVNGHAPQMQIDHLARDETERGASASYYFIVKQGHRRDGNYRIDDSRVLRSLRILEGSGMEVGVHGSYSSLDHDCGLSREYESLRSQGFTARGGRQHWLRFNLPRLISEVQKSNAFYDASLGWSETIGFRAGACFAFPPYDFVSEKPAGFLELPLAIMDCSLLGGKGKASAFAQAKTLFEESRTLAWGGFSVLWHPTSFGGVQLPRWVGDLFWALMEDSLKASDTWVSAKSFLDSTWALYADVGLLPNGSTRTPRRALEVGA